MTAAWIPAPFLADQNFDVDDDLTEEWLAYFDSSVCVDPG